MLRKIREGAYEATPKGIAYLKDATAKMEKAEAGKINFVVSLVIANKMGRSKHELVDTIGLVKHALFPSPEVRPIRDRIKKIYEDSVPDNDSSSDIIHTMWASHNKKTCKSHFDFTSAYKKHIKDDKVSDEIRKYWTEDNLFYLLHFFSLSAAERVRKNLRSGR